jgi:hypothetical protein
MSLKIKLFSSIIIVFFSLSCAAEESIKGMAQITYEGWRGPNSEDEQLLKNESVKSALSRWASKQGGAFLKNYDLMRPALEKEMDDYVLGIDIIDKEIDKKTKQYRMVVKVLIDDVRLKNAVNSLSADISNSDSSYMTFVFVSRRKTSVQSFDKKIYKRGDISIAQDGAELETASNSGIEYIGEQNTTIKVTTGGSSTRKADIIAYDVSSSSEITVAMSEIFSSNGFEIVEAEYLEEETDGLLSVAAFKADYSTGDDISGSTRRNAAKGARLVEIPYLSLGTLDIGMSDIDPVSGNTRVFVTVTGKIIDVSPRFPKTVASVGPVQFSGLGPNQSVAERNALIMAATKAAEQLVNQMNAKGIR